MTSNLSIYNIARPANHLEHEFEDWRQRQACSIEDPELFFPPDNAPANHPQVLKAKAVCRGCSVVDKCAEWAISTRLPYGVAGAMTPEERDKKVRRG